MTDVHVSLEEVSSECKIEHKIEDHNLLKLPYSTFRASYIRLLFPKPKI